MKRKISLEFILLIFSSLIVFIIGATLFARHSLNRITQLNLEKYLQIIEIDYSNLNEQEIVDKYTDLNDYLRITFIDKDGVVITDSLSTDLDNHINRPEIQNIGNFYIRRSSTLNIDMMYLAKLVNDEIYLRVAIPSSSVLSFLNDFIALSVIVGAVIIVLSIMSSNYLINQSLKPLKDINNILKSVNQGEYQEILPIIKYDEINQLINEINEINRTISENIKSLKSEKLKSDFLLEQMNQGICVLDKDMKVVLLNQYLQKLYHFNIDFNLNKDYRYLFRDDLIQEKIKQVYKDKGNQNLIEKINDRFYSVTITYSKEDWNFNSGVILIYTDITTIKDIEILKRDFFVNASHELKSPLTTILGSAELIVQGMVNDEATKNDLIERISSEAKRMNNLVMDMLILSEYESKIKASEKQVINLPRLVEEIVRNLELSISTNGIETIIDVVDVNIYFGHEEIYQIIKNLVENAIKYGKEKGQVWINLSLDDKHLVIKVKDNGIGIPKKDLGRVFERFYRVDKARSKLTGGTGLGLSIVKHIVLNYGGYIDLISNESEGTEVTVLLPKKELNIL